MTDELKHKFEQLVSDPPPPSGVPSEGVLDRVRTVKRRRTATAGILATAAVVAGVIAAGNLASLNSSPAPVTNTPTPVVTSNPTTAPSAPATKSTITGSAQTVPPASNTDDPGGDGKPSGTPSSPTNSGIAAPPGPYRVSFTMDTSTEPDPGSAPDLSATVVVRVAGTTLRPVYEEGGTLTTPKFEENVLYTSYSWGDGKEVEDDWYGGVFCPQPDQPKTMKKVSGHANRVLGSHKYAKAGTYKITFRGTYCTPSGPKEISASQQVTVHAPPGSPKP